MKKILIKNDDRLIIIRKDCVESVWKDDYEPYTYYVRMNSGTKYKINEFFYNQIRFMMENEK